MGILQSGGILENPRTETFADQLVSAVPAPLTLPVYLEQQANLLGMGSGPFAEFAANLLRQAAQTARFNEAETPEDYWARLDRQTEWHDAELWEKAERQGYKQAIAEIGCGL